MTKKKLLAVFILVGLGLFFFLKKENGSTLTKNPHSQSPILAIAPIPVRKIIDHQRKPIDRNPASSSYVNTPSPDWEKRLETSLKIQGGVSLKDIKIRKENSLVWMRDENPLYVESVVVSLTNQKDVTSSFRALVDSQTGKVLESWDQSIFDPANVKEGFRIKLDPRYTN